MSCIWRFSHRDRIRSNCGLPSGPDGLCVFHSERSDPEFSQKLVAEVAKPDHWLEGIQIKSNLSDLNLSNAKLAFSNFEGKRLTRIALEGALLEEANFVSATLEGVLLFGSVLRCASFDMATLRSADNTPVDLRKAELGGISLTGARLSSLRLEGAKFSERTEVSHLLDSPIFEMQTAAWEDAAHVYSMIGRRAAEDWDFSSELRCVFLATTCRHRQAIGAGPLQDTWTWSNWAKPTLSSGVRGAAWMLHRQAWGYGLWPSRVVAIMISVVLLFGLFVFPLAGVSHIGHDAASDHFSRIVPSLVLSLNTFVTLTYGRHVPSTTLGEFAGGLEALLAGILLSVFLVSLANKYIRRI